MTTRGYGLLVRLSAVALNSTKGKLHPKCMLLNSPQTQLYTPRASNVLCMSTGTEPKQAQVPPPDLSLSDSCVKQLHKLVEKGKFLRVLVEGGGCSGFQYKFELDSEMSDDDRIFERDGAKVVVDEVSLEYIKGSTIDYHEELIRSAFRVIGNPGAEMACSCGASFSLKL